MIKSFGNLINWNGRKRFYRQKRFFVSLTNKQRGASMAGHCQTINLTTFSANQADYVVDTFHITWQSVLLLTGRLYQRQKATLVVTTKGQVLLICQPIHDVLKTFFEENCIGDVESRVYYKMLGMPRATRSAVAGKYQLVPTCGMSNDDVVWVMTHHLLHAELAKPNDNGLRLQFDNVVTGVPLLVTLNYCGKSFIHNMEVADKVAELQSELLDFRQFCQGMTSARLKVTDYQQRRKLQKCLQEYQNLLCRHQHDLVMKQAFEQKSLSDLERTIIHKLVFKPFAAF